MHAFENRKKDQVDVKVAIAIGGRSKRSARGGQVLKHLGLWD